jgi:hypothetical protein
MDVGIGMMTVGIGVVGKDDDVARTSASEPGVGAADLTPRKAVLVF